MTSFSIGLDIDPVIICPYDSNHRIARSRIQRHLVKCEKNYPPNYKQQCPYDATHRVFEHELVEHVENCPMKMMAPIGIPGENIGRLPEIEPQIDSAMENKEVWDEGNKRTANLFDEPLFETINIKQYTNVTSIRGNAMTAKKYHSKLRRPFGYSESLMLDISNQSFEDDTQSVSSDMGIGRGQALTAFRGCSARGVCRGYRRGLRGRLLH